MANVLNTDKQIMIVGALAEGSSIRCTPAMAAGVTNTFWSVGELVEAVA